MTIIDNLFGGYNSCMPMQNPYYNNYYNHNYYNNPLGMSMGYESFSYNHHSDKAAQDWLIGGLVGNMVAGMIAPNDPETARAIGTISNVATGIGIIKDFGNTQNYYHNDYYNQFYEREMYNNSNRFWNPGSTYNLNNAYGFVDPYNYGSGGCNPGWNPWICY